MEDREFLEHLSSGLKEIPKKQQALFEALQKFDAIDKNDKYFMLKSSFIIGTLEAVREDLVFLKSFSPHHCKDFKLLKPFYGCLHGDIVLAKRIQTRAKILTLLCPVIKTQLIYLEKNKSKIQAFPLFSTQENPKPVALKARQKALQALPMHAVLRVDYRSGEILEVLGVLEDEKIDEKIVLAQYEKNEDFPKECLTLAQSFGEDVFLELYPQRKNLVHLPFCTIDPKDAKDHDDAIYFDERLRILYVAIADVGEYISKESSLDKEARKRGFSIYLPHKSIPMLPREISENLCSLKEKKVRLALVWELHLNSEGELQESKLYEAIIKSHQSLTYEDIDELLGGRKTDKVAKEIAKSIQSFYPFARTLKANRLKSGYDFFAQEIKLFLDQKCQLAQVETKTEGESHSIIEEAMLLANVESAKMLSNLPIEGIYRIHQEIRESHYLELLSHLKDLGFSQKTRHKSIHQTIQEIQKWARESGLQKEVDKMIIKAQNQAQYSSSNIGHFGLGFEFYTHFTSPIRRYSDLCIHRVLKEAIHRGKRLEYLSADFPSLAKALSELEREVSKIEIQYRDRKFAHWAYRHRGERLQVMVLDEQYPPLCEAIEKIWGARVILQEREILQERVILQERKKVERFEVLEVEIIGANLANARIYAKR